MRVAAGVGPAGPQGPASLYTAGAEPAAVVGYVGQVTILEGNTTATLSGMAGLVPGGILIGSMDYDDAPQGLSIRCTTPGEVSVAIETTAIGDLVISFAYFVLAS